MTHDAADRDPVRAAAPDALTAERLDAINRATTLARLLSNLLHEVNNSLQVMTGAIELLKGRPAAPSPSEARWLDQLDRHAAKAAALVQQVMTLSRDTSTEPSRVDFGALVREALGLRAYAFKKHGIDVSFDAPADPCYVRAARTPLLRAVLNVLFNAESALAGRERPRLALTLEPRESRVRLVVADNGAGFRGDADWFAAPFPPGAPHDGAGLGLWASRAALARDHGRLERERCSGGARVILDLPADAPRA